MSNYTKGSQYEDFVEAVYRAILEAERRNGNTRPIQLERRKRIISKSGTPAEIDIYWEHSVAGITHCVAIECKNYNKKVDLPAVRDFARKISDLSGLKGLIVSTLGFSDHAIAEASADNIDLLIIREQTKEDWTGRLKEINVRLHVNQPSRTLGMTPVINKAWGIEQGYQDREVIGIQARNDMMIFEDKATGFRHSLYELESRNFFSEEGPGRRVWEHNFLDGWLHAGEKSIKIDSIRIDYVKPTPINTEFLIDFEQYVLAVMEYINGEKGKYVVLKTGERKGY